MQASKVRVGSEYATSRGYRVRIEGPGRKEVVSYGRGNTMFPCTYLNEETGKPDDSGRHYRASGNQVAARDLNGPWEDYAQELIERKRKEDERQRQQAAYEAELVAIMTAHGFAQGEYLVHARPLREYTHAEVYLPKSPTT